MVLKCIVRDCKREWYPGCDITFHSLPTNPIERNKWLSILELDGPLHKLPRICSRHFKPADYSCSGKRLRPGVVPCNKDGTDVSPRQWNDENPSSAAPVQSWESSVGLPTCSENMDQWCEVRIKEDVNSPDETPSLLRQLLKRENEDASSSDRAMQTQLPACRCCLAVDSKLVSIHTRDFAQLYQDAAGLPADCTDRFPQHVCVFCVRSLQKFAQFRARCHKALEVLYQSLVHGNELTKEYIESLSLSCTELNTQYVQTKTLVLDTDASVVNVSDINVSFLDISQVPNKQAAKRRNINKVPQVQVKRIKKEVGTYDNGTESLYKHVQYLENIEEASVDIVYEENKDDEIDYLDSFADSTDKVKIEVTKPVKHKKTVKKHEPKTDELSEKDYAASLGFELTEFSLEEQINEIEEKKRRPGFVCELCGKPFYNSNSLQRHMHYHEVKPKSFVCDLCSRVFMRRFQIVKHMLSHKYIFSCTSCNFKTNMRTTLLKHHQFHQGKQYPCKYCDKVIMKASSYFSHMKFEHEAELPWCDLCGEPFINEIGVKGHKRLIHNNFDQYPYTCACSYKFKSEAALDRHLEVQGCDLPSCVHCGESFPVAQMLKYHLVQRHTEGAIPKTFDCKSCVFRFYNHAALTRHACGACAACAQCGDSFETTQQLVDHTAHKHPKLTCHECSRDIRLNHFKSHFLRTHAAGVWLPPREPRAQPRARGRRPRPGGPKIRKWRVVDGDTIVPESAPSPARAPAIATHICEVCGKGFPNPAQLNSHRERAHSAARKHCCQRCPKAFKTRTELEVHTRVHTGERPFQCPQCPMAFKAPSALRKHSLVHSGLRNHVCSICDKAFTTSAVVKMHIKTVHMKMPWPARKPRTRPQISRKEAYII